jgi:3-deoxy-7-phosphoheptulonate synthase
MIMAYRQSAATLNLLRAFAQGGYANLTMCISGCSASSRTARRRALSGAGRPDFRDAGLHAGLRHDAGQSPQLRETDFFTSHEALLLGYEQALTRIDSHLGRLVRRPPATCCGSATAPASRHAHVEFPRHQEPDRPQMRPVLDPDELLTLIDILNPATRPAV